MTARWLPVLVLGTGPVLRRLHRRVTAFVSGPPVDKVFRATKALIDGVVLGLVGDEMLDAIDERYYDRQAMYVDADYNLRGLFPWERELVDRYFTDHRRIALTGAGGGREVLALREDGFDVVGFEPNERLCAFANELLRQADQPSCVKLTERGGFPETTGSFDGVIVGWGAYMLLRGRRRRVAYLNAARRLLEPGDPLLVSFFSRSADTGYFRWVAALGGGIRRLRRRDPLDVGDALSPNYVHFFDEAQIRQELDDGGFEMVEYVTDDYGRAVGIAR